MATELPGVTGRSTVYALNGVAATSHPRATGEAVSVLRSGGNAVDAAVTAAAVLTVVEPHMTGIGGDMFSQVWWEADGTHLALDASGRAGSRATPEAFAEAGAGQVPVGGPATVTVPGALSGWSALLDRLGTISMAEALAPAIQLADTGFPVSPIVASTWARCEEFLRQDRGAAETFLLDGVRAPRAGEWFRNPDMAASLRSVARDGVEVFYGGALGAKIVDELAEAGGFLTRDDLAAHEADWVEPIGTDFMGHGVWELPPAGQGVSVLQMLRLLESVDLAGMGHNETAYLHHLIEAKKLAFADLARHVSDRGHMRVPVETILDDAAVAARRALIDPAVASPGPPAGAYPLGSNTVYLAVGDADGNMVSLINSIYDEFGSGIVIPGTGFALHSRGNAFVLDEGHPNRIAPGKRPFHTIIPALLTRDGRGVMAFGVVGKSMQPQGQVQLLLNLLLFGMDLQESVDAPRFRHMEGLEVSVEPGVPQRVQQELAARAHDLQPPEDVMFGGAQAVMRLESGWAAASDPRRDGCAGGY